ncbi:MAG: hypothetical protein WBA57_01355 [Elainellaceae cyanobacterium]
MNTQLFGLVIAALIGASASLIGTFLSNVLTIRRDRLQWERQQEKHKLDWLRTQKQEAYHNAIRYLLLSLNRRSGISADGDFYLSETEVREWINDLIEAQAALSRLTIYSGITNQEPLHSASLDLNQSIQSMLGISEALSDRSIDWRDSVLTEEYLNKSIGKLTSSVRNAYSVVLRNAKEDLKN